MAKKPQSVGLAERNKRRAVECERHSRHMGEDNRVKLVEIDLNLIDEDSEQPRREFDKTAIEELAESIREVGLLNPIKVYKAKYGRYKIVFGNRRYKALKLLGFRKVPCILSDNTDELDIYFFPADRSADQDGSGNQQAIKRSRQ